MLADWLTKIETLHPKTIQLGVERVAKIAHKLDLHRFECPVITVGGTNGKGSCVKFLESILLSSDYRVGAYTSPHLLSFNERIRINNQLITDEILCEGFEVIDRARAEISLTFFEFTTLAALWAFKQAKLDVLILEVGMGGRLDAVNIMDSDIAIVTSVDIDHIEWLGSTREEIGYEKAGIFRPDSIAVCGDMTPPKSLVEYAAQQRTQLHTLDHDFNYTITSDYWNWKSEKASYENLPLPCLPIVNAASALMAISHLQKSMHIPLEAIKTGIYNAKLMGRFQVVKDPISCILDVAHNPAAAKMLAKNLADLNSGKLIAVVGMLADKDISNTFKELLPYIKEWHLGTLHVPRGASSTQLARRLQDFNGSEWYTYDCITEAFEQASAHLNSNDKILVFGSFYTVAEILNLLQRLKRNACDE